MRPGYRKQGISHALIDGAVAYARERGACAIEGYPVDNGGEKVNPTMAYVGTRALFESAGFVKAADTGSVLDGFPPGIDEARSGRLHDVVEESVNRSTAHGQYIA